MSDIVSYVTGRLQHPDQPCGFLARRRGAPWPEGFVALLIGVGGLALICFWIGERSGPDEEDDHAGDDGDGTDDTHVYAESGQERS